LLLAIARLFPLWDYQSNQHKLMMICPYYFAECNSNKEVASLVKKQQ
jgi:hypothetical protein